MLTSMVWCIFLSSVCLVLQYAVILKLTHIVLCIDYDMFQNANNVVIL